MTLLIVICLLVLSISLTTSKPSSFTDDEIMNVLHSVCNISHFHCPKEGYATKNGKYWNEEKVLDSEKFKLFRATVVGEEQARSYLKNAFCCSDYPCLTGCRCYPIAEKSIIRKLPQNYRKIFQLGFPELEPYKLFYEKYLNDTKKGEAGGRPAEIEELYDLLHKNEDKYLKALKEKEESQNSLN